MWCVWRSSPSVLGTGSRVVIALTGALPAACVTPSPCLAGEGREKERRIEGDRGETERVKHMIVINNG